MFCPMRMIKNQGVRTKPVNFVANRALSEHHGIRACTSILNVRDVNFET